ncbi:MAG: hypothetical protein GQ564_19285 [Bacteroidales bacterium]|nr:hypothetical protein [Bacteroidales bacterium]
MLSKMEQKAISGGVRPGDNPITCGGVVCSLMANCCVPETNECGVSSTPTCFPY